MKINSMLSRIAENTGQTREMKSLKEKERAGTKGSSSLEEKVSFSTESKNLVSSGKLETDSLSLDDTRSRRIESLKHQIQSGTYTPDPERIAKAMLGVHGKNILF